MLMCCGFRAAVADVVVMSRIRKSPWTSWNLYVMLSSWKTAVVVERIGVDCQIYLCSQFGLTCCKERHQRSGMLTRTSLRIQGQGLIHPCQRCCQNLTVMLVVFVKLLQFKCLLNWLGNPNLGPCSWYAVGATPSKEMKDNDTNRQMLEVFE